MANFSRRSCESEWASSISWRTISLRMDSADKRTIKASEALISLSIFAAHFVPTKIFLLQWPYKDGKQEVVIELKLLYGSLESTIEKGLEQTWQYMDKCGTKEGYLLIFNQIPGLSWEKKIFKQEKSYNDIPIIVYGM